MSDLYLTKIAVQNFRTFGNLELDLPPAPGITLIVGPNGLGKSSFFDSIEWALTGSIRRFESYLRKNLMEEEYLTRRGAEKDSHRVELSFGKLSVLRDASSVPKPETIVSLLKAQNWGATIEDLSTYLAFTHFLGQASDQRFTSRDSDQQWNAVKGPSGIDRLEEVRNALRGRATLNAFNRRIDRDAQEVATCAERLTSWQLLVERASRLRQVADAGGAMPKEAILAELKRLEDRSRALSEESSSRSPFVAAVPNDGIARLSQLRSLLEQIRNIKETRLVSISGLVQTTNEYGPIRAAADAGSPAVDTARATVDRLSIDRSDVTRKIAQKQEELRKRRAEASSSQNQIVFLKRAGEDRQVLQAQLDALGLAEEEAAHLGRAFERLELEQRDLMGEASKGRQLEADLASKNAEAVRLADFLSELRDLEMLDARTQQASTEARQAQTELEGMTARRETIRQSIARLEGEVANAEAALSIASEKASEISSAISAIAVHLTDEDTECPLCQTGFAPGELRRLVRVSSEQNDAAIAAAQELLADRARQLQANEAELTNLSDRQDRLVISIRNAADLSARLQDQRRALATALNVSTNTDLGAAATGLISANGDALARARLAWEDFSRGIAGRSSRIAQIEQDIKSTRKALDEVSQRKTRAEREIRDARERIRLQGRSAETEGELTTSVAAHQNALETLEAEVANEVKELEALASEEALVSRRLLEAQAQLNSHEAAMETASKNAAAIEAQWKASGLPGLPNAASLSKRRADIGKEIKEVDLLFTEQERLVEAYEKALQNDELQSVVLQLESMGGAGSAVQPDVYEQELTLRLREAEAKKQISEVTKTTVSALAETLQKSAAEFSARFLLPLNDLIDQFNEALLSYPGETIRFKASHHVNRTKFDMQLRYRDQIDDAVYNTDLPPQIVLSEGQLAANGFSILCAASVAYPWSKWKALLLDDPLQHNDIIHAAAFVDLMRNLVERKRYQLLMSSHERTEAEFIRRKFDAAGIPCTVLELTAPSRSGVTYLPAMYNDAAKALF